MKENNYDMIVIGAGPAGLTAALYGLRAGKKVLALEGKTYGGQIINAKNIENYPGMPNVSGVELMTNLYNQVINLGGEVKLEQATKITIEGDKKTVETDAEETYSTKALIMATGADNSKLGLPREKELMGRGVSYCATCDGNFYKGKDVAVIGGGNTALEDAIYLADIARRVYLIHRRNGFRGDQANVDRVRGRKNIELVLEAEPTELLGEKKVEGLMVKYKDGAKNVLDVSGVFIAVGYVPQNREFSDVLDLDEDGYIDTKDGVHTNVPGVYVAGDARAKELKQLTTAVADGSIAATTAIKEMR